jgi:hypothetical protein
VPETGSPWRASAEVFCGVSGHQWGNPSLKRDSPKRGSHSHQCPSALELSTLLCRRSRHGLARPSRAPPARGGTQLGVQPARMGCASVCRKDPCRCLSSRRPCCRRVCVLRLQTPQRVGATKPVFLRAAVGGAWPPVSTRYALLHPSGVHHRLPPWDVPRGDAPSRFFLQHSGGRMFTSLVKVDSGLSHDSIPRAPNSLGVGSEPCCGSISLALRASVPPPTAKRSVVAHPPYGRRSRRAQVRRTRSTPCAAGHRRPRCSDAARGVVQDVVRRGGGGRVLGWSCPHPRMRTGVRASSPWCTR